jgi:hypothetical protein
MDNDDTSKLIDARNEFRLRKLNNTRAQQGLSPLTMKDLMMQDKFGGFLPSEEASKVSSLMPEGDRKLLDAVIKLSQTDEMKGLASAYRKFDAPLDPSIRETLLAVLKDKGVTDFSNYDVSSINVPRSLLPDEDIRLLDKVMELAETENQKKAVTAYLKSKGPLRSAVRNNFLMYLKSKGITDFSDYAVNSDNVLSGDFTPKPIDPNVTPSEPTRFDIKEIQRQDDIGDNLFDQKFVKPYSPGEGKVLSPSFGKNASKLAEENARRLKEIEDKSLDPKVRRYRGQPTLLGGKAETEMTRDQIRNLLEKSFSEDYTDFEKKLFGEKADELLQTINSEDLPRATPTPPSRPILTSLAEEKSKKLFDAHKERDKKFSQEIEQRLIPFEREKMSSALEDLKSRNPMGKVSVDYADFRNPFEKAMDYAKTFDTTKLGQMATEIPAKAGKVLSYAAPPLAVADLLKKSMESGKDIEEQMREKGKEGPLLEILLDIGTIAGPMARMAGKATLGAAADYAAIPLGAYLAGREFFPPSHDEDSYNDKEKLITDGEPTTPYVVAPGQSNGEIYPKEYSLMPNYPSLKKLLETKSKK